MKPSYEELEQKLIESERYGRAADITIENLERKVEQLAAENAGLKSASSCLVSEYMMNKGTDSEFIACITPSKKTIGTGGTWDMWRHLDMVLDTTPATDAFLAEVRASGVEMFASVLESRGRHQDYVQIANAYSAQLRKGVQS